MAEQERLEIDGEITPAEAVSDLSSHDWVVDGVVLQFRADGTVTCTWPAPYVIADARRRGEALLRAYLVESDIYGDITFGSVAREFTASGGSIIISPPAAAARITMGRPSILIGGVRVGPNPESTAWLAALLLSDDAVYEASVFLQASQRASGNRTRDDRLAFEVMEHSLGGDGGRNALRTLASLTEKEMKDLGNWLQVGSHETVTERGLSVRPGFDAANVHGLVHKIFLAWARDRADRSADE
ncbi:hypothetical protein J0H33_03175 [bacterium]|jgi:hypothetical protein|nr:hypothetical protein [bacterium]